MSASASNTRAPLPSIFAVAMLPSAPSPTVMPEFVAARTRLVTSNWKCVPLWRVALLRFPITTMGVLRVGWIAAVCVFGETRRTIHDRIAGTHVVVAEAAKALYSG